MNDVTITRETSSQDHRRLTDRSSQVGRARVDPPFDLRSRREQEIRAPYRAAPRVVSLAFCPILIVYSFLSLSLLFPLSRHVVLLLSHARVYSVRSLPPFPLPHILSLSLCY